MKIYQRVQEIWSGQESVTERQTDRQMDWWTDGQTKAISIIPNPLRGRGLIIPHPLRNGGLTKGENGKSKKGRVVFLVCDMSSSPVLHFYQVPSKYSEGYWSYWADIKSISNKTKGDISKSKQARVVILVCNTLSHPVLHFYQVKLK